MAQRHVLRPSSACESIECCCCCAQVELLCAMLCCCQDEHFGFNPDDPYATPQEYLRPPQWIREVDEDPVIGLIFGDRHTRPSTKEGEEEEEPPTSSTMVPRNRLGDAASVRAESQSQSSSTSMSTAGPDPEVASANLESGIAPVIETREL